MAENRKLADLIVALAEGAAGIHVVSKSELEWALEELGTLLELERGADRDFVTFTAERKVIEKARAFFSVKPGKSILECIVDLESAVRDLNACDSTKKLEDISREMLVSRCPVCGVVWPVYSRDDLRLTHHPARARREGEALAPLCPGGDQLRAREKCAKNEPQEIARLLAEPCEVCGVAGGGHRYSHSKDDKADARTHCMRGECTATQIGIQRGEAACNCECPGCHRATREEWKRNEKAERAQ